MFAATLLPLILAACDLQTEFAAPEAWKVSAQEFVSAHRAEGYRPVDQKMTVVNSLKAGAVHWGFCPLWESKLHFGPEGVSRIEMSLYNRGDAEGASETLETLAELDELVKKVAKTLDPNGKMPPVERKKSRNGGVQCVCRWSDLFPAAELTWGCSNDKGFVMRPDFVRLVLTPKGGPLSTISPMGVSRMKVKANVRKNPEGDVWIENVPMVDQGQKGYCACAVTERVLRYYGSDIDEHQIAQMAGTSAQGGTSVAEMIRAVKAVGLQCKLAFQSIVSMTDSVKDIEKEAEKYNRVAKSLKAPTIDIKSCREGRTIMVGQIRDQMRPEVVMKMRMKDVRYGKFLSGVKSQVDAGVPVFWGVTLGLFPERGIPQARGGHMRLIIGYNAKTREILYTDSWGAGHERKRMPEDQAFAITHDAFYLKPR